MKTAITFLLSSFLLLASLSGHAAIFSTYPLTNVVKGGDVLLLNVATGDLFKTRSISVSNFLAGLTNVTINVSTSTTVNSFVTEQYVVFEYVTNLFASYSTLHFATINHAYISNAYITNLYVTNFNSFYQTANYAFMNFAYITNLYTQSLSTNQYVASDTNKMLVSTLDGGAWTNLNAASIATGGTLPALDGGLLYGLSFPGEVTNASAITFRDLVGSQMATLSGGGNDAPDTRLDYAYDVGAGAQLLYWHAAHQTPADNFVGITFTNTAGDYSVGNIQSKLARDGSASGNISLKIYNAVGGYPAGTALGSSSTFAATDLSTSYSASGLAALAAFTTVTFTFASPPAITNGGTYAVVWDSGTYAGGFGLAILSEALPGSKFYYSSNGTTWPSSLGVSGYRPYLKINTPLTAKGARQLGIFGNSSLVNSPTNVHFGPLHYTNAMMGLVMGNPPTVVIQNGTNGPADLSVRGGYFFSSNAVSLWPTIPRSPGDVYWGNSNGVQYQLSSGRGSTWLSTNQIGASPQ